MAKRKSVQKKRARRAARSTRLHVDVKMNILHTIADAIYSTAAGKIREAVANSRDNGATWVVIALDQTNRRLSIFDNGSGITRKRFQEIFDSIGYGGLRDSPDPKMSYFGLGLMSIFQLGNRVRVYTRARGQRKLLLLEVQAEAIFDKANKEKSITELSEFMGPLKTVSESAREQASLGALNEMLFEGRPVAMPESFTEIIVEDIRQDVVEEIGSRNFRLELAQVLPLRAQDNEPFLKRFSGSGGKQIVRLLKNDKYCESIDVYFGAQEELEEGQPLPQLWKYFPRFSRGLRFTDDNVRVGTQAGFAYYVVHTNGEDLQGDQKEEEDRETGFWIRNQNFLVKSADFLDRPGPGRPPKGTIHKPLRNWVFGEVFHADMNPFLRVGRNEFLWDTPEFKKFRDAFLEHVSGPVNKAIRDVYDKGKPVVDDFIAPFAKIADNDGPIVRAETKLRLILGENKPEREFWRDAKDQLAKHRMRDIEDANTRIDRLLAKRRKPLIIAEDENVVVSIDPSLAETPGTHEVRPDASSERVIVNVSPALFAPRNVRFLGETFEVVFVAKRDTEAAVSINFDSHCIYVNPFNGDLSRFSVSILDVYIALEVADAISRNKGQLKRNFLRLLGTAPSETTKYVTPLGDDLRRTAAYGA